MLALYFGFWEYWNLRHKVTFDGVNRLIIVNDGVTQLDVQRDIYSAWKEWVLVETNARYLKAINTVGGDPTVAGQRLDVTYFLINGWKIKPYPGSYTLNIIGNIFDVDGGEIKVPADVTDSPNNITINTNTSVIVRQVNPQITVEGSGLTDEEAQTLSNIETSIAAQSSSLSTILYELQSPSGSCSSIENQLNLQSGSLSVILYELQSQSSSLADIINELNSQSSSLSNIETQFNLQSGSLSYIETQIDIQNSLLSTIDTNIVSQSISLSYIETQLGLQSGSIANIESILTANSGSGLTIDERTALFNIENKVISIENLLISPVTASLVDAQQQALFDIQTKVREIWKIHGLDPVNPMAVSKLGRSVDDIDQDFNDDGTTVTVTRNP